MPPSDRPARRKAHPARTRSRRAVGSSASARVGSEDGHVGRVVQANLAHALGRDIVSGAYRPGSLLPNVMEMCSRFSVSRTALREAYSTLAAKGLIVARPKVGTRVRPKAEWNMLDPEVLAWHVQSVPNGDFVAELYALREMVEPAAAARAALRPGRATIERIGAAYADMERFKDGAGDLVAADLRFHSAILEATGSRFVGALGSLIHAALLATFSISWEGAARIKDERLHQHRAVFEAIRDGLPELASKRMAILLRDSFKDVQKGLRRRKAKAPAEVAALSD